MARTAWQSSPTKSSWCNPDYYEPAAIKNQTKACIKIAINHTKRTHLRDDEIIRNQQYDSIYTNMPEGTEHSYHAWRTGGRNFSGVAKRRDFGKVSKTAMLQSQGWEAIEQGFPLRGQGVLLCAYIGLQNGQRSPCQKLHGRVLGQSYTVVRRK